MFDIHQGERRSISRGELVGLVRIDVIAAAVACNHWEKPKSRYLVRCSCCTRVHVGDSGAVPEHWYLVLPRRAAIRFTLGLDILSFTSLHFKSGTEYVQASLKRSECILEVLSC